MSNSSSSVAFSDFSFQGKIILFLGWLIKSTVLFSIFFVIAVIKTNLSRNRSDPADVIWETGIVVIIYSLVFLVFYIITERILQKMLLGMILSIIGTVIAAFIPQVGIIIALIGIFSMISKVISVIKMIPLILLGFLLTALLFADELLMGFDLRQGFEFFHGTITFSCLGCRFVFRKIMLGYFALSILLSLNLAFKYNLKNAMMRQVVIFMAIPITALIVWLVRTSLENAFFEPSEIQQVEINKGKIWIKPYTRGDGIPVRGHWRSFLKK